MKSGDSLASSNCMPCIARPTPVAPGLRCARTIKPSSPNGSRTGIGASGAMAMSCNPKSGWRMPGSSVIWASTRPPRALSATCRSKRGRRTISNCRLTCIYSRPPCMKITTNAAPPSPCSNRRCNWRPAMASVNCCSTKVAHLASCSSNCSTPLPGASLNCNNPCRRANS
ncbi:hypothetical protein D3C87_1473620 [compost metagenome]